MRNLKGDTKKKDLRLKKEGFGAQKRRIWGLLEKDLGLIREGLGT
jgi:hypothetical protein